MPAGTTERIFHDAAPEIAFAAFPTHGLDLILGSCGRRLLELAGFRVGDGGESLMLSCINLFIREFG